MVRTRGAKRMVVLWALFLLIGLLVAVPATSSAAPGAVENLAGCTTNTFPANDDHSTGLVPVGFGADFFGTTYTQLYVNNNGNVTFDSALSTYTPFGLASSNRVIVAPFFGDVDTRAGNVVTYGQGTFDGQPTFCVNWVDVGYYSHGVDKLNSFQLLLVDRGSGDFDIIFNYDKIQWETGGASGGSGGLGGNSARVGYSSGGSSPTSFELAGSAINGAFLDSNSSTGLIHNSMNSSVLGRYIFQVRNGVVIIPGSPGDNHGPIADAGPDQIALLSGDSVSVTLDGSASYDPDGDSLVYLWSVDSVAGTPSGAQPSVTFTEPGIYNVTLQVSDGSLYGTDTATISVSQVLGVQSVCPPTTPVSPYTDVSRTSVHALDVDCISYHGITVGTSPTTFTPAGTATRWQMALFVTRALTFAGVALPDGDDQGLADIALLPGGQQKAINQLQQLGMDRGVTGSAFNPNGTVTRADTAWYLAHLLEAAGVAMPSGADTGFTDIGSLDTETQTSINQIARMAITVGTTPTTFEPARLVRRDEMATFLARTLGFLFGLQ